MSKEEIKALIAAKIAGQGTMVDLGGALPTILDAIIDAIPEGGEKVTVLPGRYSEDSNTVVAYGGISAITKAFEVGIPVIEDEEKKQRYVVLSCDILYDGFCTILPTTLQIVPVGEE